MKFLGLDLSNQSQRLQIPHSILEFLVETILTYLQIFTRTRFLDIFLQKK